MAHPHIIHAAAAMDTDIATVFQSCGDGAVDCTHLVDIVRQAGEGCEINGTWSSIRLHVLALNSVLSERTAETRSHSERRYDLSTYALCVPCTRMSS